MLSTKFNRVCFRLTTRTGRMHSMELEDRKMKSTEVESISAIVAVSIDGDGRHLWPDTAALISLVPNFSKMFSGHVQE